MVRFVYEHSNDVDIDLLSANVAYGLSANQTLLLGLPYRLSPGGTDQQGDLSILYRHILWQQDRQSGTSRLGLLGGAIIPTESGRDEAFQAGFVFTHFQDRNEFDVDALYQAGIEDRPVSGRYDVSWQYRLSPTNRPDWGIPPELSSVLELNGRWQENDGIVHQITAGLQRVYQQWGIEGGIILDLDGKKRQTLFAKYPVPFLNPMRPQVIHHKDKMIKANIKNQLISVIKINAKENEFGPDTKNTTT